MRTIQKLFIFILLTFLQAFQAFTDQSALIPEQMLLSEPSCIVNHSVNVITGYYQENETDIEVAGPYPLLFQRSYISGDYEGGNLGYSWNTNHAGSVQIGDIVDRISTLFVSGDLGSDSTYEGKVPKNKKELTTHVVVPDAFNKYMAHCPDYCCSPGCHLRNNRLYYKKKDPEIVLTTGNGYLRHYVGKYVRHLLGGLNTYYMDYEKQPNGSILRYKNEGNQRHISLENENGGKHSSLTIEGGNVVRVASSDGKWVNYHLSRFERDVYYLTHVEGNCIPSQTYEYSAKKEYKNPKIIRKRLPEGRYLCNEYYQRKDNQVGEIKIKLNYFDPRIDRIMIQKAPVGSDNTPVITHRYFYDLRCLYLENETIALGGSTTVFDAYDRKTIYSFNDDYRITDVYKWNEANQNVYSIEKSFWGANDSSSSSNLISRALANGQNEVKLCRSYEYDHHGNVTKKHYWGNLTGKNLGNIILDQEGKPHSWSSECCTKTYTYELSTYVIGSQNRLLTEFDGKKTIENAYYPNTNLVYSKFVKVNDKICKREFNAYDGNKFLYGFVEDDGSETYQHNLSSCTECHITLMTNRTEAPIGLPEVIEKRYVDVVTGQEFLEGKVRNQYSPMGKVISQEHYDSENTLKYTLEWKYDDHGNITMEKNALGQVITRKYDLNNNLIYEEGPIPGLYKELRYDFVNRLIGTTETHPDGVILINAFRYDLLGNMVASMDPYGQETRYIYDHQNRLIETILPLVLNEDGAPVQPSTKIEYDLFNNPCCITDAAGGKTIIAYTAYNKPYYKTYPDGTTEQFEYDTDGNLRIAIAKNGTRTIYHYDHFDRVVKTEVFSPENELLETEFCEYNAFHLLSKTDSSGATTRYEYNKAGKLIRVTKGEMKTEYQYDTLGRESKILTFYDTGKDDYTVVVKEYDLLNRVIEERIENALGQILKKEKYDYNWQGNRQAIYKYNQAGESITRTEYDTRGQIISITNATGEQVKFHYRYDYYDSLLGQCLPYSEATDSKGVITVTIKDALGRQKSECKKDPFGKILQKRECFYTPNGHLGKSVDTIIIKGESKGEIVNLYKYDPSGNLIETCEADGTPERKITKYTYDTSGQKKTEIKPDGTILHYIYDALGRLKEYRASDNTFHYVYEYDLNGNPIRIADQVNGTETEKFFDKNNRLIQETLANGLTLKYTYDLSGKPIKITFPDESGMELTYENEFLKEVSRISEKGEKLYSHLYDNYDLSGNVTACTLIGKAGNLSNEIDLNGRLKGIHTETWTGSITSDKATGNVSTKTFKDHLGDASSDYTYDELNQLIEEIGDFTDKYSYDSLYNRIGKGADHYTLNHLNQIIHDGKSHYEYDPNGNLIKISDDASIIEFTYDALNRLVEIKKNSQLVRYTYDEMNRRLSKTVVQLNHASEPCLEKSVKYFYQGLNEVGCYEDGKITELRLLGLGKGAEIGSSVAMEFNQIPYAPIHDQQGNVVCLVDANTGQVKEFYRYNAYGEEVIYSPHGDKTKSIALNPWRFSSKRTDNETGYVYFGRRYYDSKLGRWITPDPIGYEGGPNLYAYVLNNPLASVDLYGLSAESISSSAAFERNFFDTVKDFFCATYETIRDSFVNICNTIGEGLSRVTSALCDTFSAYREERQITFNQRMLQSAMNRTPASRHTVGTGESLGVYFTNGMNTLLEGILSHAKMLSDLAGGILIQCIYNPSNGFFHDFFRVFHSLNFDMASNVISELHDEWNQHFEKFGMTPLLQICYSEGTTNVRNALMCYNPELRKLIDVLAIAPSAYIGKDLCRNVYHYVSARDFVPWFDFRGRMNNQDTTIVLKPHKNANFWDHDFQSPTYQKVISHHIERHLKSRKQ